MATVPWTKHELTELAPITISVEQYLHTAYSPDCDYVEGIIEERNVGEFEHSLLQTEMAFLLRSRKLDWNITVLAECRLQVAPLRFRVPDLMILHGSHKITRIVRLAPLLCIEVLSPEDRWEKMRARLNDYLALGTQHLWCFDPQAREARTYTPEGFNLVTTPYLAIPNTPIRLSLAEVFSVLDDVASPL